MVSYSSSEIQVPNEFFYKKYVDLNNNTVYGVDACAAEAYDPFRKALVENFDKGWAELMKYDWASVRSYLTQGEPKYPLSVVHWMENRSSGTGGFDRAFSEVRTFICPVAGITLTLLCRRSLNLSNSTIRERT